MTLVMFQIFVREQNLRDDDFVRGKKFVVSGHEPRLTDGGARLFFRKISRTRIVTERAHACADRATGNEHNFLAGFFQRGELRNELFQLRGINQFPAVGQNAGSQFDDQARNGFKKVTMHAKR
jgi:hypothetical protein